MIAVLGFSLATGCAGYGSTRFDRHDQDRLTELMADFESYHVFYSGMSEAFPSGIIFDPREGGKTIARKKWVRVENRDVAKKLIRGLESYQDYPARLYLLTGADGQFYGYIYTAYKQNNIFVRQLSENEIHVLEMPEAPHLKYDPNGSFGSDRSDGFSGY